MKLPIVIVAIVIVAVTAAAGGFYGGMTYAQSQAQNTLANFAQQRGLRNPQGTPAAGAAQGAPGPSTFRQGLGLPGQAGAPIANGQVKSISGDTVEISTANDVVTVKVDDQTLITRTDRGTLADIQVGDRVIVFSRDTGSSPTASGIQIQAAPVQTNTP
jgi:hypothetical protein